MAVERNPSLDLLLRHAEHSAALGASKAHPDAHQDAWALPEVVILAQHQWDASPSAIAVWDAWDDVRPDASVDDCQWAAPDADAGKSAVPELVCPEQGDPDRLQIDLTVEAAHSMALDDSEPGKQDVVQSAARSCAVLVAAFARLASLELELVMVHQPVEQQALRP